LLTTQIIAKQNRLLGFYFCGMKRIFILILSLILSGCGLFKKSVEKHTEKIELEQETIWQISEKSEQ